MSLKLGFQMGEPKETNCINYTVEIVSFELD